MLALAGLNLLAGPLDHFLPGPHGFGAAAHRTKTLPSGVVYCVPAGNAAASAGVLTDTGVPPLDP